MADRVSNEKLAYDQGDVYANSARLQGRFWHVFKSPNTQKAESYFDEVVRNSTSGSTVLDYGCYTGALTPKLLSYRAKKIIGIDISEKGIGEAKRQYGDKADFHVMDAHNLQFDDETFDLIVGRAILHHLEFDVALREIARVLRPGGRAVFIEPLRDNPAGKLIRRLTPHARTTDELPLSRLQIEAADKLFHSHAHRFANLASVPVAMTTSLFLSNPNNIALRLADRVDGKLAASPMKYWMRFVVLVWEKKATGS